MNTKATLLALAALSFALPASAQTPNVVIRRGDPIPGFAGTVRAFERFEINDFGEWLMLVETNNSNVPYVVLRSGFLTLELGQPLAKPVGASISGFNSLTMNNSGFSAWEFDLSDVPNSENSGVYLNTKLLVQKGMPVNLPGFESIATWFKFGQLGGKVGSTKINDNRQVLLGCEVKETGPSKEAIVLLDLDAAGNVVAGKKIALKGDPAPQSTSNLNQLLIGGGQEGSRTLDFNDNGDVIYQGKRGSGQNAVGTIYVNNTIVGEEGSPSPVQGESFETLNNERVSINNQGDYVFTARITGPGQRDEILVRSGTLYRRERIAYPAIAPYLLASYGLAPPVYITEGGDVFHYATWTGPGSTDRGIFFNDQLIMQRNVTTIEGILMDLLPDNAFVYDVSPNGRYVMFNAILADDANVVCVMDLGRVTPLPDCGGNTATLYRKRGYPLVGKNVRMSMDDGQGVGVTPFLLVSDDTIPGYPPCGVGTGWGELVIDFSYGNPVLILIGTPWGGPEVDINIPIANDPTIVGRKFYAQGIFFDVGNQIPGPPAFVATNGVELELGAP